MAEQNPNIIIDDIETIQVDKDVIKPLEQNPPANPGDDDADKDKDKDKDLPPANPPAGDEPKPTIVTIEDASGTNDYTLDEEGNATLNGQIVYTKQQLIDAGFENTPAADDVDKDINDANIHTLISDVSGIELLDDEGKPVSFKPGLEGLADRDLFIKNTFYAKGKEDSRKELFDNDPDLAELYNYKKAHGSLDNYTKVTDYSKMEIKSDTDVDDLKNIIREHRRSMGDDDATVERFVKMSENDETLRADAAAALTKLQGTQQEKLKADKDTRIAAEKEEVQKAQRYYGMYVDNKGAVVDLNVQGSMYDKIVKQGVIGEIMIPKDGLTFEQDGKKVKASRLDLFAYFYNPIKLDNGRITTRAELDEEKRISTTDNFIVQGIRNLTGNDLSSLTKTLKNVIRMNDAQKIIKIGGGNRNDNNQKPTNAEIESKVAKGTAKIIIQ